MKKIEIKYNQHEYSFILEKYKVLYGISDIDKYNISKSLKQYFNKEKYSEYGEEYCNKANVRIDEIYVDVRDYLYYEISNVYDLNSDAKLNTKSLILKYLENNLEKIEYDDEFSTIKSLLEEYVTYTLQDKIDLQVTNEMKFQLKLNDFNYKSLIRLIEPLITKDELEINNYDLSYEEIYIFQLKIIESIASKIDKKIIVLANIPYLTDNIVSVIKTLSHLNLIIFSSNYNSEIDIENYMFMDLNYLDFFNEETINEFIMNLPWHTNVDQLKNHIKESLKKYNLKHLFLNKII